MTKKSKATNHAPTQPKLPNPLVDKFGNHKQLAAPPPIVEDTEKYLKFCFELFDRNHPLFNLGCHPTKSAALHGEWFIDLLDCLREVSATPISDLRKDSHDLHPVNWSSDNINARKPAEHEQLEYWQFRLNKGNGRVIGAKIGCFFYIVWLDPHHNLIDSEGYGKARYYYRPKTEYEKLSEECDSLRDENNHLKQQVCEYEELFNQQ